MRIARVANKYAENYVKICETRWKSKELEQLRFSNLTNDNKWKLLTDFISTSACWRSKLHNENAKREKDTQINR